MPNCPVCGEEFVQNTNGGRKRVYCSKRCQDKAKHEKKMGAMLARQCEYCGEQFMPAQRSQKYCWVECRTKAGITKAKSKSRKEPITKQCEACGEPFVAVMPFQRYCSKRCGRHYQHHSRKYGPFTCKHCGKEYMAKEPQYNQYCSRECAYAADHKKHSERIERINTERAKRSVRTCAICGKPFANMNTAKYCSDDCRKEQARRKSTERCKQAHDPKTYTCKECRGQFTPQYGDKSRVFCSDKCAKRFGRRKRKNDKFGGLTVKALFVRDGGRCQLCGRKLSMKYVVPHSLAPTRDHIIPRSKGGSNIASNLQLACFECNCKRKRDGYWKKGEQLRLIG